jgi:hypothetical protein
MPNTWHVLDILSIEEWAFLELLYIVGGATLIPFATHVLLPSRLRWIPGWRRLAGLGRIGVEPAGADPGPASHRTHSTRLRKPRGRFTLY